MKKIVVVFLLLMSTVAVAQKNFTSSIPVYESKDFCIDTSKVTATDTVFLFKTRRAIVVDSICVVGNGAAINVTVDYRYGSTRNGAGTAIITTPAASTSITTGTVVISFNNASIPVNNFVRFRCSAVTTKSQLGITFYYH